MIQESRLTLNPRVSVLRHNGGVYLSDPATRTYASMNEAMLAFVTKPDDANSSDELSDNDCKGLTDVVEQLCKLGILITPETANQDDKRSISDDPGSMINLALFITTKCNLRCAYCYASGGEAEKTISRDIWHLALDHFFSILSSDATNGQVDRKYVNLVIHGGGEPTVEFATLKEIVAEFCDRARAAGLIPSVAMSTNGTYGDSIQEWIIENDINVTISLDGPRDIQNRLRPFRSGQPSYDIVVRNLQGLIMAGMTVSVRSTITNEALETMEATTELVCQLGLSAVHFETFTLIGRCATSFFSRPDAKQFAEKFLKCFLLGLKLDVDVRYSGMRYFEDSNRRYCGACGHNFCVTPDGNITTCYEVLNSKDPAASVFFIGKVDPIQGRLVLDQARIEQLKQRVAENMEACRGCFLKNHCAGDCPVKSFRHSNRDLYSPDPYRCQIAKRVNKQIIAWLADGVIEPRDVEHSKIICL